MDTAADPFASGVEAPADDPFEGADAEFEQTEDPFAEATAEPVEGLPVVNAEGEKVEPKEEEATQVAASEAPAAVIEDPPPAEDPPAEDPPAEDPPAEDPPPAEDTTASSNGNGKTKAAPKVAKEKPDAERRAYRVITPVGDGKWEEVTWYEKDGKVVDKGTAGATATRHAVVHNKEAALRMAYRALGSPAEGARLAAFAERWFQVKLVKPETVPTPRTRVTIS